MSKRLRAVVVTNEGVPQWEMVVQAIEAFSWHPTVEEALACQDDHCRQCHRLYTMGELVFDFDRREVFRFNLESGTWEVVNDEACHPIPADQLAKFDADFGVYYSS
jgi:hypothetical protein